MKKKVLSFLLMLCFVIPCVMTLVACGKKTTYNVIEATWKAELKFEQTKYKITQTMKTGNGAEGVSTIERNGNEVYVKAPSNQTATEFTEVKVKSVNETKYVISVKNHGEQNYTDVNVTKTDGKWTVEAGKEEVLEDMDILIDEVHGDFETILNKYVLDGVIMGMDEVLAANYSKFTFANKVYTAKDLVIEEGNGGRPATKGDFELKFKNDKLVKVTCTSAVEGQYSVSLVIEIG